MKDIAVGTIAYLIGSTAVVTALAHPLNRVIPIRRHRRPKLVTIFILWPIIPLIFGIGILVILFGSPFLGKE